MTQPGSATRRRILGSQLRALRESRGITRADAGYAIRASESKISRVELGRVGFKERDVEDLLSLYGVTDPGERGALLRLAAEANQPGWWQAYHDLLPAWLSAYLGLEEAASLIRCYEPQFVPPLLQTEEYARAMLAVSHRKAADDELDRRVDLVLRRRQAFFRPGGPRLWAVLDEAVLHRRVGDPDVHRRQLEHLRAHPSLTLQILPFSAGEHPAHSGAFSLLRFPQPDLSDIAYVQSLTGSVHYERRDDLDTYLETIEHLSVAAMTPDTSRSHLAALAKAL